MSPGKDKKNLSDRLDVVAVEWKNTPEDGFKAVKDALWAELFTHFFELYDEKYDNSNLVLDVFEYAIRNFDPEKGAFSHYVNRTFRMRKVEMYEKNTTTVTGEGGEYKIPVRIDTLDQPVGEGDELKSPLAELMSSPNSEDEVERVAYVIQLYYDLISKIINFDSVYKGKANNPLRRSWFRLFFTEDMTLTWKLVASKYGERLEREAFRALNEDYLDYYMSARCRSARQVSGTPLKPYCKVVPAAVDDHRETPVPIPADVSLAFLGIDRSGRTGRSNFKGKYRRMVTALLDTEDASCWERD